METNNQESSLQQPVKILVVDDREDNLLSIETILDQENYRIVKASSGKAALKVLLREQDFTLILMDVQMPEMDGIETANLIYQREKLRHIPIIFITAHNYNDKHVFEGYKVGAVDYIYKPINPELLRIKVSVFAELYQKTHKLMEQERVLKQVNASLAQEVEERKISEEKIKLLNEQLLTNNQSLKQTVEELDRFAYVASHDLQEPLRKILVFSDKLLNAKTSELSSDILMYMEKIVKASERMQRLINDLLIFSRELEASHAYVEVDLNQILEDVLSDMEVEIENNKAVIAMDPLPKLLGIPSQMRQLFQNLISNAIKFKNPKESPVITVRNEPVGDTDANSLDLRHRIIVADNGIGFDQKYADDIFVVFKRLHSYHEYEGTGVGLSICKKIVERHNGTIKAISKIDEGTRFIIDFPIRISKTQSKDVEFGEVAFQE